VLITDRGRPVARLVPARVRAPIPDLKPFRRRMPRLTPPLSQVLPEERDDRL